MTAIQGGTIALKVALDNGDLFAGLVLIAPSVIICPRSLSTSSVAVSHLAVHLHPLRAPLVGDSGLDIDWIHHGLDWIGLGWMGLDWVG